MPRLFVALPVPEEIADALIALQSGVPDARWVPSENLHVTLCFAGEVQGGRCATSRRSWPTSPARALPWRSRASSSSRAASSPRPGRHRRAQRPARLAAAEVSTVARNCGIELERRKFRPHVTLARFGSGADTGHHLAQFMASHSTFKAGRGSPTISRSIPAVPAATARSTPRKRPTR